MGHKKRACAKKKGKKEKEKSRFDSQTYMPI